MNEIEHVQPTFEDFWREYPRKISKRNAEKSWKREVLTTSPDEIMVGLRRQLPYFASRDHQFIPHPATWLNQARWSDELQIPAQPEKKRSVMNAARDLIGNSDDDYWLRPVHH